MMPRLPSFPINQEQADGPAAMLPNGNILVQTSNAFSVDKNGVHDPVGNESQAAIQAQPSGRFPGVYLALAAGLLFVS